MKYFFSFFILVFSLNTYAMDNLENSHTATDILTVPLVQDYRARHNSINVSFDSLPGAAHVGVEHVNAILQEHWIKLNDSEMKDIALLISKGQFEAPYTCIIKYFCKPVTFITHITYHASLLGNVVVLPFSAIFGNGSNVNVGKVTSILSIIALLSENINNFFNKKIESNERVNLILHAMREKVASENIL
jgi:hypothetical protein